MFENGVTQDIQYERQLEDGVERFLNGHFEHHPAAECRGDEFLVWNTARGGRKTGKWSQPDFTLVALQCLQLHKRIDLEISTFELKRFADSNVDSVFEAVAHTRYAHYAYLVWHQPSGCNIRSDTQQNVAATCRAHGVGLIVFSDPPVPASYDIILAAERKNPHPVDVEAYLTNRLRKDELSRLRARVRELEGAFA